MSDKANSALFCSRSSEPSFFGVDPSILMLETPNVEEIARAIWQRQHDALDTDAIYRNLKWRDESIPIRFWDEFVLDAHAVLSLLRSKNIEYRNK